MIKISVPGTSLVVQWLRLCLPMQWGRGSIPGLGARIPHASWPKKQNIKQKQYCNKFNKDFKNGPHQKKSLKKKDLSSLVHCFGVPDLVRRSSDNPNRLWKTDIIP